MITEYRFWFLAVLFAANTAVHGETPQPPQTVAEIPLKSCTPTEALGVVMYQTIERTAAAATQSLKQTEQLEKLMNQLPKHSSKPVGELMTPAQSAEFAQLSAQMRLHTYNDLAESGLERDAQVMAWAAEAIEKMRKNEPAASLRTKYDPGADGAALVGLLREALKNEKNSELPPPAPGVCSVDLALHNQSQGRVNAIRSLFNSAEMTQLNELRAKYHVPDGQRLDPDKLPSPDREKAVWLDKAVGEPIYREVTAMKDWENLRLFARASQLEYDSLRNDILIGSGSPDYDYDTGIKAAYKSANPPMQRALDAWTVINKNVKSEKERSYEEFAEHQKASQPSKP